ncbi:MAG TPA: MerR family transcriptional regulator [Chlamydiales bacterium]|nr:MerR family transcriptional regulator [Chlamydiales bacterium]
MEYSITSLAKQARVTVRTLRHYDQVGLLKPLIRMASGKRIYGDEQFLRLFEITFFKRIGLSLPKIKSLFLLKDYNKAAAAILATRRQQLAKEIKKLQRHITSIEMTIPYYQNSTLSQKERLDQFRASQNAMKEMEEIQVKEFGKEIIEKGKEKLDALSADEVDERVDRAHKLMRDAIQAIEQGLKPDAKEVQGMIKRYYNLLTEFNPVTREAFLKLRDLVLEHKSVYTSYHPKLAEFLYDAMDAFAREFFDTEGSK